MSTLSASSTNSFILLLGLLRFNTVGSSYLSVPWGNNSEGYVGCDPCLLDPPDDFGHDYLHNIPTDDDSLCMLVQMKWPKKDVSWYLRHFKRSRCGLKDFSLNTFISNSQNLQTNFGKERDDGPVASLKEQSDSEKLTWEDEQQIRKFSEEFQLHEITRSVQLDTERQLSEALEAGERFLNHMDAKQVKRSSTTVNFDDMASLRHQRGFKKSDAISSNAARLNTIIEAATLRFKSALRLPNMAVVGLTCFSELPSCRKRYHSLMRPNIVGSCNPDSPYRTIDGSCNNVANELWGAAFTSFRRDLTAHYSDGVCSFPSDRNGMALPSARFISTTVNNAESGESKSFTIMHMTFGQFLDHDLTSTPITQNNDGDKDTPIKCCGVPAGLMHPECAPIAIPSDDPFYGCFNRTCMEFVRSAPAPSEDCCCLGQRQQTNVHSAYLDGSVIYGTKPSIMKEGRTFHGGLLKYQLSKEGEMLLPRDMEMEDGKCNTQREIKKKKYCFKAGDGRVNEQIILTVFHTIWIREHNRLARRLQQLNEPWDDERLFQETRRIVGAQLQQITYSEFLPTIIGPTLMAVSKLNPLNGDQQTTDYDREINAAIANNFATSAYRFGHSLITDNLIFMTKHGKVSPMEYSSVFFNPFDLYRKDRVCDVARGAIHLPQQNSDPLFSLEVAGKMFRGSMPFGLDLFALNIQRGRDHGLPPYNKWRVYCGLPKAKTFKELTGQMSPERIDALKKAYNHVDDVDLFVGAMSEKHIPGAMVGHTFTCLLHNQFLRIKYGDRYWFEYKDGPGTFTKAQVEQLHKVTLARIMCDNLPELKYIQRWPLENPGPQNPRVCCKSIRKYNLNPWKMDNHTS